MWLLLLLATALASPADSVYLSALSAWDRRDWDQALQLSRDALSIDPDHGPARLLEGYALLRQHEWEEGMTQLRLLQADPVVGENARWVVRRHDNRWRRDQAQLSVGILLRDDRDPGARVWVGGLALAVEVPLAGPFGLRLDGVTPWTTYGSLDIYGPQFSLVPVWHHTWGTWGVEAAVGPSIWVGEAEYWEQTFRGAFPGLRASTGVDARLLEVWGMRLEVGYTRHWGARQFFNTSGAGWDLRWMSTVYAW